MNKRNIKLGDALYWNTNGAYNTNISLQWEEIHIEQIENGEYELLEILTHKQYEKNCYRLENN